MTATVTEAFDAVVQRGPDTLASIGADGVELTFAELRTQAVVLARGLLSVGVRPGEAVAILGDNTPRWTEALLACLYAGCPAVGLNTWHTPFELGKTVRHAGVRTILACVEGNDEDRYLRILTALGGDRAGIRVILRASSGSRDGTLDWMTIAARGARHADPLPTPEAAAAAAIVYTSGSTGTPKGAVLSHGAIASAGAAIGAAQGVRPGERVWSHFPFFFSGGLCNFTMGSLLSGAGMVLAPRFDVAEAVAAIEQYRCSVVHAWPNIARRLIDQAGDRPERLASLRTGTWPLDLWFPDTALGHVRGINLYGMTETCTIFTSTTVEDGDAVRAETHGRPFEGCEVKVVDDAGRRLPTGEEGALRLRGFNVMSGYHDTPAGTGFDEDGFLITSDAGILQDDGYLRWTGRLDDMIRTSGIQVSPIEVEQVLEGLPGITKAGVTGVPHERRGEAVVAFITVGPAAEVDEEIALQWCRERLAGYKVPTSITVLPESELPLLGSGKLDRKTLKATAQPGI